MNERTEQIRADYAEATAGGTCLCGTDAYDTDDFTRILPVPGACKYTGKFVTLAATFTELEDDDKHVYKRGEPLEICEKTAAVLGFHLYKKLFILVDRAAGRSVDANETDCGDGCCC
jgi:hypothetical protein